MKKYIRSAYDPNALLNIHQVMSLRKEVANDISDETLTYDKILKAMDDLDYFSDWTVWERDNRPVNSDDVYEYVYEYLERNGEL